MAKKYCYLFTEGNAKMRELLGGKGANLAEMTNIGLPVPQGFTISTEACTQYYEDGRQINPDIQAEIMQYIDKMENITGKKFGDKENPLLVSVRSGARASMPGMMDTILNLGLNEEVVEVLAKKSGNPRWAYDCYRRFIQMFSDVVMEVGKKYFEKLIDEMKEKKGVTQDVELDANDLKELANQFKAEYKNQLGKDFPSDPKEQLFEAIKAVFRSWDNPRANIYRMDHDIPYSWGTAVNVQMMAFGNMGDNCGTGVAFTRNPATGEKGLMGEFLTNAQGILTVRGGQTSHAAVVARGMGTCCVSGCGDIKMDEENKQFTLAGKVYKEGDGISLDGSTGNIYDCIIPTVPADPNSGYFGRIMELADKYKALGVRTNADTPKDAKQAAAFGAQGIGLCRTEHMFFGEGRIDKFREMICAETVEEREAALEKIEPMQQADFEGLFEALGGYPVTIRFLDPPLHEFVPTDEADIEALAKAQGKTVAAIKQIISDLHEFNPMMGHRGCRLTVTYPEIAVMQTKAVIKAAIAVQKKHKDWKIIPEIMIPLTGEVKEMKFVKDIVVRTADEVIAAAKADIKYEVGTMIEIPRAALTADEIAKEAEFFCFGTNDLTQMTFGFSRDDAGKFLPAYYANKIYESDPFARLDTVGVGKLMKMAVDLGKGTRPELHCGICGEHGGDPSSIEFCHEIGLTYVSCSPFRVPIARLAAAQAAIKQGKGNK